MNDWAELRDFYRPHVEAFVDDLMRTADDPKMRAWAAVYRERLIDQTLDAIELGTYRRILAARETAADREPAALPPPKPNGLNGHAQRVFKA